MILNESFYKIHEITREDNSATVRVELLPSHPIYAGHFPGQPVVPGVCTLTIIKECIEKVLGGSTSYASIKECKYLSALIPEENLYITISITIDEGKNIKAVVNRDSTHETVLKLKAVIK